MSKMKTAYAKPLSKRDAFLTVARLHAGASVPDGDLDGLLLYFAPKPPKSSPVPEIWVARAVATRAGEARRGLFYAYSKDGWLYASDGSRAHRCKTGYPEGFYEPRTLYTDTFFSGLYPSVERLFDRGSAEVTVDSVSQVVHRPGSVKPYDWAYEIGDAGTQFCKAYVDEALNGHEVRELWLSQDRLWGRHDSGEFVIAHLRD